VLPGGSEVIAISDAHSGDLVSVVHQLPWAGMNADGLSVDRSGHLWVTLSKGPDCSSNVAGCGPVPHSCASEVLDITPATGQVRTVLRGGNDELIGDATRSPDGRQVAYLHSGCATFYFDNDLRVRNLATGHEVDIGGALPSCHVLSDPHWTPDSTHLVLTYGAASTFSYAGSNGTCSSPQPAELLVVAASTPQSAITGSRLDADPGCEIQDGVPTVNGYAAVEHCGDPPTFIQSVVQLVEYNPALRLVTRTPLGHCEDGASIAVDQSGADLIAATYQYCNPPGTAQPETLVTTINGGGEAPILEISGDELMIDQLAW